MYTRPTTEEETSLRSIFLKNVVLLQAFIEKILPNKKANIKQVKTKEVLSR